MSILITAQDSSSQREGEKSREEEGGRVDKDTVLDGREEMMEPVFGKHQNRLHVTGGEES